MNVSSTRIIFLIIVPLSLSVKAKRKTKINKIQILYTFLMKSKKSDDSTAAY